MKKILIVLVLFLSVSVFAQRKPNQLYIDGTVLGYDLDPQTFWKKEKVEIQGSLSEVTLDIKNSTGKTVLSVKSDKGGAFGAHIPIGDTYKICYSKSGYSNSAIQIDLKNIPQDIANSGLLLTNIELILNENETDKAEDNGKVLAKIAYNIGSKEFTVAGVEFDSNERLFKKLETSTPVNLLKGSIAKNKENNRKIINHSTTVSNNVESGSSENNTQQISTNVNNTEPAHTSLFSKSKLSKIDSWKNLSKVDLDKRSDELKSAWKQLEQDKLIAVTEEDFLLIQAREEMLIAAEKELEAARLFIGEQEGRLKTQGYLVTAMTILFLFMLGFIFILIRSIREKKKSNFELDKRNKKITASIKYAERIQKSILPSDEQFGALLPNSFVFYKPLDVVSGDLYWISEVNGVVVIAAIDCTGHGVPGAFMSLIGNTLMNQIVNEKKVTSPAEILTLLHEGIVSSLRQDSDEESAQDGMDMSVCSINKKSNEVLFAGAMNSMFVANKDSITEVSANLRGIGGVMRRRKKAETKFTEQKVDVSKGSMIYLFSDGYMDQFGGANKEKFNIARFKTVLTEIQDLKPNQQKEKMEKAINEWKGSCDQIDDMLVIGARI